MKNFNILTPINLKQFLQNNKLFLLQSLENPVAREICLLTKLVISDNLDNSIHYIKENISLFPFVESHPEILNLNAKNKFIQSLVKKT